MSFTEVPIRPEVLPRCGIRQLQHWSRNLLVSLDTETTGLNVKEDRIVEIAACVCDSAGAVTPLTGSLLEIINPGVPVPERASDVHKLTTEKVEEIGVEPGPVLARVMEILHATTALGMPLVIFNAAYDWPLLYHECQRHNVPFTVDPIILDPLCIDRHYADWRRGKGKRTLEALSKEAGVWSGGSHSAWADALAAAGLLRFQAKKWNLDQLSLSQLHKSQETWHSKWVSRMNAWAAKKGKPPIGGGWPLPNG